MYANKYLRELQARLRRGQPFVDIEDWVEDLDAAEDIKAALWLLAWTDQERLMQRRIAREAFVHLTRAGV
jgi:hypothetical protein